MALYLEQKERDLLKKLIGEPKEFEFLKIKVLDKIKEDEERLEGIHNCDHEYHIYNGVKDACSKCSTFRKEVWTIEGIKKPII